LDFAVVAKAELLSTINGYGDRNLESEEKSVLVLCRQRGRKNNRVLGIRV